MSFAPDYLNWSRFPNNEIVGMVNADGNELDAKKSDRSLGNFVNKFTAVHLISCNEKGTEQIWLQLN